MVSLIWFFLYTTEQATTLQPAACPSSLLKELMTTGNDVPVGAEETVPAMAAALESEPVPIWFRNEDGDYFPGDALQPILVPEGYPGWEAWAQIPNTRTVRAIDLDTQTLCLFRDGIFKKRPLTSGFSWPTIRGFTTPKKPEQHRRRCQRCPRLAQFNAGGVILN